MKKLIGPFSQLVSMRDTPLKGPLNEDDLSIVNNAGIVINDEIIESVGDFSELRKSNVQVESVEGSFVLLPGLVDSHTHMCFGGSRAGDYSLRVAGKTYQEILKSGGGIHDTVQKTRDTSEDDLVALVKERSNRHLMDGVTTSEVKSGYGLSVDHELKMLRAIKRANETVDSDLITTCLAAHVCPKEFESPKDYLDHIVENLFPVLKNESLTTRIDIFTEDGAFNQQLSEEYLQSAKQQGFDITIHADQFSNGGSELAVKLEAISADHLEASTNEDIERLADSNVICTVLPGASLGLGMHFSAARKLLDAGCSVAIATDWNPGSGPMGDLLIQTALIGAYEKLSIAECLAGITFRAARALKLNDRGKLEAGYLADMIAFRTEDYRELMYQQGKLKPEIVWKSGERMN